MTAESDLTYRGPGPFHLPAVQRARADVHQDNGVTMHLFVLLPGRGSQPESVSAQMIPSMARDLGIELIRAAEKAEKQR